MYEDAQVETHNTDEQRLAQNTILGCLGKMSLKAHDIRIKG